MNFSKFIVPETPKKSSVKTSNNNIVIESSPDSLDPPKKMRKLVKKVYVPSPEVKAAPILVIDDHFNLDREIKQDSSDLDLSINYSKTRPVDINNDNEISINYSTSIKHDLNDGIKFSSSSDEDDFYVNQKDYSSFFSTDKSQIISATGCKPLLADLILNLGPFTSNKHLISIFNKEKKSKTLFSILDKYLDTMVSFKTVDKVISRCENHGAELVKILTEMGISKSELDISKQKFTQPTTFSKEFPLKDYQLVGVAWLSCLYKKKLGCILADEMYFPLT